MPRKSSDFPSLQPHESVTRRSVLASACGLGLAAPAALVAGVESDGRLSRQQLSISAGGLLLAFQIDQAGLTLVRLEDRRNGVEYLATPSPVFRIATHAQDLSCQSNQGVEIQSARVGPSGTSMEVKGIASSFPLAFVLTAEGFQEENAAVVKVSLTNRGAAALSLRATAPYISGLKTNVAQRQTMAAVPQEAGGVVSFSSPVEDLGMGLNRALGLPTAMNIMELASIYDPDGNGGVFFADAGADLDIGIAPVQLTFSAANVSGHSVLELNPGETKELPSFTVGVHNTGDWHDAVDHYVKRHRPHWHFPEVPAWFRDQGAIYSFSGSGGGAIYMEYPQQDLASRIPSFDKLHLLLDEAQRLGTNIVYLWDYWEGTPEGGRPAYWNKGDYVPRADLGGPEAFKNGIRSIHERGGRVILYVEPFIVFWYSELGKKDGQAWAGRDAEGSLYHQYPQNYSMISCFPPWQKCIVDKAKMLVEEYGADGIYLDSWGWQMNWRMKAAADGPLCTPLQYSLGVLELAKQVREAIRTVRPDAIVMGETTSGALSRYWDGGLSADFAWLAAQNQHRMLGSPVRYGLPEVNIYTNGRNRNELNQVFAAGHSLALLNANLPDAEYIRTLVKIRQAYKDALIHGKQVAQLKTGDTFVPAYYYEGSVHHVITVANTSSKTYSGDILVHSSEGVTSTWRDLVTGQVLTSSHGKVRADVAGESLLILARLEPSRGAAS